VPYEVKAEDATALRDKLKPNIRAELLANSYPSGLEVGETHIFALGVNNVMMEESEFLIDLDFLEARDTRTNYIETDADTVIGWLSKNEYDRYTLEQYENVILPVGITVGEEISPGVETQPGVYYFRVTVIHQKTRLTQDDYSELDFSIRVI
jgi:hypothetical protein